MDFTFIEVSLVLVLAGGLAVLMHLLKQPLLIGYMVAGVLIGPLVFNFTQVNDILDIFAHFGVSLLLFIVGLGLNPKTIKQIGPLAVALTLGQMSFITLLSWLVLRLFGYSDGVGLLVGLALAFSSTIVVLKLISDKKEQNQLYGKVAVSFLLVQDTIIALLLVFVAANNQGGVDLAGWGWLAAKGLGLGLFLWFLASKILTRLRSFLSGNPEVLFLFSLAWGLGIGVLFYETGFSLEVGALAAGVALASQTYATGISVRLRPLRDFFLVTFFVTIGAHLQLDGFSQLIWPAIALSALVIFGKFAIITFLMKLAGFSKKTSFRSGLAITQISEFSLIFVGTLTLSGGDNLVNLVTLVAWTTITLSSYLLTYSEKIYSALEKYIGWLKPKKLRKIPVGFNPQMLLIGYTKGGEQFIKTFQKFKKTYLVIDYNPQVIDQLERSDIPHLAGDVTDSELLDEINLDKVELIVLTLSDFIGNSLLVERLAKKRNSPVIICSASSPLEASHLYQLGASYVMLPHYIGNRQVIQFIHESGIDHQAFYRFRRHQLKILAALDQSVLKNKEKPVKGGHRPSFKTGHRV